MFAEVQLSIDAYVYGRTCWSNTTTAERGATEITNNMKINRAKRLCRKITLTRIAQ